MTIPGGNPLTAVPGLTPTFPPSMMDGPVFVTAEPASTAKFPAVPKSMAAAIACGGEPASAVMANRIEVLHIMVGFLSFLLGLEGTLSSPRVGLVTATAVCFRMPDVSSPQPQLL